MKGSTVRCFSTVPFCAWTDAWVYLSLQHLASLVAKPLPPMSWSYLELTVCAQESLQMDIRCRFEFQKLTRNPPDTLPQRDFEQIWTIMVPHGSTFLKLLEYVRITGDKVLEYLHAPVTSSPRDDSTGQAPCRFHAVHQKNQKRKRFDCCSKVLEYFRSESNLKVQICRLLSKHTSHIDPCRSIWHRQIQIGL